MVLKAVRTRGCKNGLMFGIQLIFEGNIISDLIDTKCTSDHVDHMIQLTGKKIHRIHSRCDTDGGMSKLKFEHENGI